MADVARHDSTESRQLDDAQSKARAYATLAGALARRDAARTKIFPTWPVVMARDPVRKVTRARAANFAGSPLASTRSRGDEHRRLQRRRPLRTNPMV